MDYVKVLVQISIPNENEFLDYLNHFHGAEANAEAAENAIEYLNREKTPFREVLTYLANGAKIGDVVVVPYGANWQTTGLVIDVEDEKNLDPNITYKGVIRAVANL